MTNPSCLYLSNAETCLCCASILIDYTYENDSEQRREDEMKVEGNRLIKRTGIVPSYGVHLYASQVEARNREANKNKKKAFRELFLPSNQLAVNLLFSIAERNKKIMFLSEMDPKRIKFSFPCNF